MQIDEQGRKHFDVQDSEAGKIGEIIVSEDNSELLMRFDRFGARLSNSHRSTLLATSSGNVPLPGTEDETGKPIVVSFNVYREIPVADYDDVAQASVEAAKARLAANRPVRARAIG